MDTSHNIVLKFSRRYSMGHRLISGAAKNCQIPHGHDEVVTVNIASKNNEGLDPNTNMLVEFEDAKGLWFKWIDQAVDHSFHINREDPIIEFFRENEPDLLTKLLVTPGDPTTEIRAACYHSKLSSFLNSGGKGLICIGLQIQETPTNAVYFSCDDIGKFLPSDHDNWWNRADLSINDLD
ncbi:MAG: 6-carboxytetrahydropterin synthase [Verrucomicrobiota bacterium]|nr:6-carboxytetrahydropterin synthase [Verrucomicrobiota bacterium]MEC8659376.1 6-carboxytetrahydropterin synthase [Verrucomicrobiota bacterium]MEC8690679.1 6-carboxytetrahydropterin synthase [Verrucomicrobiota bacterium]